MLLLSEANKHDFRGYYGLGQTYEILKMPHYALYYYKQAHRLRYASRPHTLVVCIYRALIHNIDNLHFLNRSSDSRILHALGSCHIELQQDEEAKKVAMANNIFMLPLSNIRLYLHAVSFACHCIQRPGRNFPHKACQVKTNTHILCMHSIA